MTHKQSLHICLISDEYPPDTGWGGIGTYTYNISKALIQAGHKVSVITACLEKAETTTENGLTIYRIGFAPPLSKSKYSIYSIFKLLTSKMLELRRCLEFSKAASGMIRQLNIESPVDIIETPEYNANGYFITHDVPIPVVVKIHTPTILNYRLNSMKITGEVRIKNHFEKSLCRKASLLTSPSIKMAEIATEWLGYRHNISIIPNPIDLDQFSPDGELFKRFKKNFFLYTGRLERRKGVITLLKAFKIFTERNRDFKLVLAGHDTPTFMFGGKVHFFKEFALKTGLIDGIKDRVIFLGKIDRLKLPPLYRASYACVFPSEQFENFPYSCLEAMSCGKAVIVTSTGGMAEMVVHGVNGLYADACSAESLAHAMAELALNREKKNTMGIHSRKIVEERYSPGIIASLTLNAYRKVLDS